MANKTALYHSDVDPREMEVINENEDGTLDLAPADAPTTTKIDRWGREEKVGTLDQPESIRKCVVGSGIGQCSPNFEYDAKKYSKHKNYKGPPPPPTKAELKQLEDASEATTSAPGHFKKHG